MRILELAEDRLNQLQSGEKPVIAEARARAWRRLESLGLPTKKTESWRYSNFQSLECVEWKLQSERAGSFPGVCANWLRDWGKEFDTVVLINGQLDPAQIQVGPGYTVEAASFESFAGEDGFSSLNSAIATPGLKLVIHSSPARPLLIFKFQEGEGSWQSGLHQVHVMPGVSACVAEVFVGSGDAKYLRSDLGRIEVAEGAKLEWLKLQCESTGAHHFAETKIQVKGELRWTQVNRGSAWLKSQLLVDLLLPETFAQTNGLTFGVRDQHVDQRVVMTHQVGHNTSAQLFKGVFADRSRGTVNGKIFIARDAQKVNSHQLNHNLLLSDKAEVNTKPELEVYADDVKANHGASVGRLDDDKLFYLVSRGIHPADAERWLSEAFTSDVLMKVENKVLRRLAGVTHEF
ncbi:MAG: SufD family Fe-S cluster assembly protein [Bdellovibrionales bacterium]